MLEEHRLEFRHEVIDPDNPADPHCKAAGDIDGDGYVDLLAASASGGGLFWYRYPDWSKHRIAEGTFTTDMAVADMDGDGCLDIVVAKMHQATAPQEVAVYLNQGQGVVWEKQVVATTGSHNIALVDVGNTGWLDIYGANWNNRASTGGAIELWRNLGRR